MSAKILSGVTVRNIRIIELANKFKAILSTPELAIIQVGNRPDSAAYIAAKIAFAKKIAVIVHHVHLLETISQDDLIKEIKKHNENKSIKGIIVQLPLPIGINRDIVINTIDPRKDIDGLTSTNTELLNLGRSNAVVPATARGVIELLNYYNIQIKDKKITVVGRSQLVGRPISQLLSNKGAFVTVAHSKTVDLVKETKDADIIITAVGKSKLISADNVCQGQIIIDVGISREGEIDVETGKAKLVGDVDFDVVKEILGNNGAITPVPGGVGPMTVVALFENLLDACV
jgi:methylenetetrahydrofolate dehydrogenase (NADP+)/methenyltetrahydrofolate cyclohydrolase